MVSDRKILIFRVYTDSNQNWTSFQLGKLRFQGDLFLELTLTKGKYLDEVDKGCLEKVLSARGLSVFPWSDRPGAFYAPHEHGHDEVIVVLEGVIEFSVAEKSYLLESGDELLLPKGTIHSASVPEEGAVSYLICS